MAILRMLHLVLGSSAVMRSLVVGVYLLKHLAAPVMLVAPVIIPASSPWWVVPCTCARGILPRRSASTRVLVTKADMVAYTTHPGKDVALLHCAQNCPQLIAVHFVAPVTREIRHVQSCAAVVLPRQRWVLLSVQGALYVFPAQFLYRPTRLDSPCQQFYRKDIHLCNRELQHASILGRP